MNKDICGKKFCNWTVISKPIKVKKKYQVLCRCICTKERQVDIYRLEKGLSKGCGCDTIPNRKAELKGKKFGNLTVINLVRDDSLCKKWVWLCKCDCGNETNVQAGNLCSGNTTSCGCLHYKKGSENGIWSGHEEISGNKWCSIRNAARVRNLLLDLNIKEAWDLFIKQNRECFFTGEEIYFAKSYQDEVHGNLTASLDRLSSDGNYNLNNVVWVHKEVNQLKLDLNLSEFMYWCKLVSIPKDINNTFIYIPYVPHSKRWSGVGLLSGSYFLSLKNGARGRKIEFNITKDYLWNKYLEQNGQCSLTGVDISLIPRSSKNKAKQWASVDRIDSSIGYIESNIHWVHKRINDMKWDLKLDRFIELCTKIHNNSENIKKNLLENYGITI